VVVKPSKSDTETGLGISRFKIARLLEHARGSGPVRIELDHRGGIDLELSVRPGDGEARAVRAAVRRRVREEPRDPFVPRP
jgi:hypothetical protein